MLLCTFAEKQLANADERRKNMLNVSKSEFKHSKHKTGEYLVALVAYSNFLITLHKYIHILLI